VDRVPQLDNIVGELVMQAATRWAERRRSALAWCLLVALYRLLSFQRFLPFLTRPKSLVVVGIIGTSLPFHLALQSSFLFGIGG
jgi:hypothetical protein